MKNYTCHAKPPERAELSNNPVKMCNEISHLFRAHLRGLSESDEVMSAHGTRLVISFLAIKDGVTQQELVNATHMRAPTISVILKKLEDEGIVERKKEEEDMRKFRVHLTEKGRNIDKQNIDRLKATDAAALNGITDDEKEELMRLLSKIRDNLVTLNTGEKEESKE